MSRQKLFTTVVASLRSFRDLSQIAEARTKLEQALQAQRMLSEAASRFVPHDLLLILNKQSITEVRLGENADRTMAIMVCDIRGFATITERMNPQENFDFVNEFFGRIGPPVRNHGGFILKYMGDGMMAAFPGGSENAVQAGIDILQSLVPYNRDRLAAGQNTIKIGIAVHLGQMRLGIVGEAYRLQGDAFSDEVNITVRLEEMTKHYNVSFLVSDAAVRILPEPARFSFRPLARTRVRGKENSIAIHECFDADLPEQRELKQRTRSIFEDAVARYTAGDFWEAGRLFKQVAAANPQDQPVQYYLRRSAEQLARGANA